MSKMKSHTDKDKVEMVTIPKREYDDLLRKEIWLQCLEDAGVDNWQGIDVAYDMMHVWDEE